jgi:hypothetical protein
MDCLKSLSDTTTSSTLPFYAQTHFVKTQQKVAIVLLALGILNAAVAHVHHSYKSLTLPLVHTGSALFGLSLLQQVLTNKVGYVADKARRIVASILMICFGPVGIVIGGFLWKSANKVPKQL